MQTMGVLAASSIPLEKHCDTKLEERWIKLFQDPSMWWDNREKYHPHFKHSATGETLRINTCPRWLHPKLASLGEVARGKGMRAYYKSQGKEKTVSSLLSALKQCTSPSSLGRGKALHLEAVESGCYTNRYVGNALMTMYSKCGIMQDVRAAFDSMVEKDVVSWNILILGYVECGESLVAMDFFLRMDFEPSAITFVGALKACVGLFTEEHWDRQSCLETGMAIHKQARERGLETNVFVSTNLVDMYCKCMSMRDAQAVFDRMDCRNVVSWTSLILGYVENGQSLLALELFTRMNCEPNCVTFVAALRACTGLTSEKPSERKLSLEKGMVLHKRAKERGFDANTYVANMLVDMYSKCGSMEDARIVFDNMLHRNAVSWASLLCGYVESGQSLVALDLFMNMDCEPDFVTYIAAFKACTALVVEKHSERQFCLENGMFIHKQARELGFDKEIVVENNLVDMYSKCGSMSDAQAVFNGMLHPNAASWTSLIIGYVEDGQSVVAMKLFREIDCKPDPLTFLAVLKACASAGALTAGREVHAQVCRLGLEHDHVIAISLVDFYGKCSKMAAAELVFNKMRSRNIVAWNALIAGYSLLGETSQVFSLVRSLQESGLQMNGITLLHLLTACNHVGLVKDGKKYFDWMCTYGVIPTMEHYTCMVDMLGRANRLEEALSVVQSMPFEGDSVVWTTLLQACRNLNNLEVGKVAFDALLRCSEEDAAAACVVMREMYSKLGVQQD